MARTGPSSQIRPTPAARAAPKNAVDLSALSATPPMLGSGRSSAAPASRGPS
ncbi:hypothetical protein ACFQV2_14610 [Actinokineospora soli]|uniref:Uncharacterized protein n=1 Tax=Actinokineospora soli TaxID=1048753 RepID=A0ABW2TLM7_9PSEU